MLTLTTTLLTKSVGLQELQGLKSKVLRNSENKIFCLENFQVQHKENKLK